jgi:predicted transcriptional regulator
MHKHTTETYNALDNTSVSPDETPTHELMARIHQSYAPTLDIIECEVLDALLQETPAEAIACAAQLHIDTVRRAIKTIDALFGSTSPQQLIDNCHTREWSSLFRPLKNP